MSDEKAGNDQYQQGHMNLIFKEGFSFSGYERDHLYLNLGGKRFTDISGVSGIDSLSDGRSAVLADFDNDGDLDVFLTAIQGEGHLLFRNNVGQENRFLRLSLQGTASGRDAFGTLVRLKTSQGTQTRLKAGGEGFLAQHDPRLLFGLGKDQQAEWLEVNWPSGTVQRWENIPSNSSLKIVEGEDRYQIVTDKRGKLPAPLSRREVLWSQLALRKGAAFPALQLQPLAGAQPDTATRLQPGTALFINLWASWCGPCRHEMPQLQKLRTRFEAKGIRLAGISLDSPPDVPAAQALAESLKISYPLYVMQQEELGKIFAASQVFVPLSILVDRKGRVIDVFGGWNPETERQVLEVIEGF